MENHLKRVLSLVRKTGDTMVVVDKDGNDSFVVMDLDRYESMLNKSSIKAHSTSPDGQQAQQTNDSRHFTPEIWDIMQKAGEETQTWDVDRLSDEELADLEKQYQEFASKNVKETIEHPKPAPSLKSSEDEYGEEQFYLEPIE